MRSTNLSMQELLKQYHDYSWDTLPLQLCTAILANAEVSDLVPPWTLILDPYRNGLVISKTGYLMVCRRISELDRIEIQKEFKEVIED